MGFGLVQRPRAQRFPTLINQENCQRRIRSVPRADRLFHRKPAFRVNIISRDICVCVCVL